jgi:hypothetical protein
VIEPFRNRLWPDYKTGDGIEPALLAQFHPPRGSCSVWRQKRKAETLIA